MALFASDDECCARLNGGVRIAEGIRNRQNPPSRSEIYICINEIARGLASQRHVHDYTPHVLAAQQVVRGGVEPPTFRFSGAGTAVRAQSGTSLTVLSGHQQPAIDPGARR